MPFLHFQSIDLTEDALLASSLRLPPDTQFVEMQATDGNIRWAMDGQIPTANLGYRLRNNEPPTTVIVDRFNSLVFVAESGSATLSLHYWGSRELVDDPDYESSSSSISTSSESSQSESSSSSSSVSTSSSSSSSSSSVSTSSSSQSLSSSSISTSSSVSSDSSQSHSSFSSQSSSSSSSSDSSSISTSSSSSSSSSMSSESASLSGNFVTLEDGSILTDENGNPIEIE